MIILPFHDYYPHQWKFAENCVFGEFRQAYIMWARRLGKDDIFINMLPIMMQRRVGVYYYMLPHFEQVRKTVWENVGQDGKRFIDYIPPELVEKRRDTDMTIIFKNGSILKFLGSDNYENLRGPNPVGIIQAEYQDHNHNANADFYPIILENGGFMWKNGIHPATKNHAFRLWNNMVADPSCYTDQQTWHTGRRQNGKLIYSEENQREAKQIMRPEEVDCNLELRLPAQSEKYIYGGLMNVAYKDDRIQKFKIDTRFPVDIIFDLGCSNVEATLALWGLQKAEDHFKAVLATDFIGQGIEEALMHVKEFLARHYLKLGGVFVPHDALHRRDYFSGENIIQHAAKQGIRLQLPASLSVKSIKSGIQNGKNMIPMTIFHGELCKKGIEALENYQRTYNPNMDTYGSPIHDKYSHLADAWRYASQLYSRYRFTPKHVKLDIRKVVSYNKPSEMHEFRAAP